MKGKKTTKLQKAKKEAHVGTTKLVTKKLRIFKGDILKHYIRVKFWLPRAQDLISAREDISTISYLSLCGETALDVRLFRKEKLIDLFSKEPFPFVYCEYDKLSFQILNEAFNPTRYSCIGFQNRIEDIATDPSNENYGNFWGKFPFDVINLDFWGDIHKTPDTTKNTFYAIHAMIFQQSLLRKPYELWITWRAKEDRVGLNIRKAYQELIQHNINDNSDFKQTFDDFFPNILKLSKIPLEDLVNIGFRKWLLYVANRFFSVIEDAQLLVYSRRDKRGRKYTIRNYLLRIVPFEDVTIPSPASPAAEFCNEIYQEKANMCCHKPIDVDKMFNEVPKSEKDKLQEQLQEFTVEYEKEKGPLR